MQAKHGPGMKDRGLECRQWKGVNLRSACGVSRMDGISNESVYERFGSGHVGDGKKCGVVEEEKRQTLKLFGHMERMEESRMTRRVYE